jgi:hypothetical protein
MSKYNQVNNTSVMSDNSMMGGVNDSTFIDNNPQKYNNNKLLNQPILNALNNQPNKQYAQPASSKSSSNVPSPVLTGQPGSQGYLSNGSSPTLKP